MYSSEPIIFNLSLLNEAKTLQQKMNMDVRLDAGRILLRQFQPVPYPPPPGVSIFNSSPAST